MQYFLTGINEAVKDLKKPRRRREMNMSKETFYVTTPIYYPSDRLHIGHAYTTTAADAIARFKEMQGYDTMFLTGSDEHGQKIERRAEEAGENPRQFVNKVVATFIDLWQKLGIEYDQFIRTTDENHQRVVQEIFQKLYDKGDIYLDKYEGWYCTPCESYWQERQVSEEEVCPDCGRPLEWVAEESYFFKMSKYADRLLEHIKEHSDFIQPESRRNEMINFIESGLDDLSVSRTTFDWGIECPVNEDHVIYVWIDALSNYITAMGYLSNEEKFNHYWPADIHLVGKDILRFHTIIWPSILMALDLPLPKQVFGHGWLLTETGKMSKSVGNVVDPLELIEDFGRDAIRYFLLREVQFGADGTYSTEALIQRINSDLANDLGNLLNRTVSMVEQYFSGVVPAPDAELEVDRDLKETARQTQERVAAELEGLHFTTALEELWQFVRRCNNYIDQTKPWILGRDESQQERLGTILYNLLAGLRQIAIMLKPFLVDTPKKIGRQIGAQQNIRKASWEDLTEWQVLRPSSRVEKGDALFPRIDLDEYFEQKQESSREEELEVKGDKAESKKDDKKAKPSAEEQIENLISFEDFKKLELKVARVIKAERISGSDNLMRLKVDLGQEQRQLVAGLAGHYSEEELKGKEIVIVANLEPAEIFGVTSQGMLLAAEDEDGSLALLQPENRVEPGSHIS